MEVVFLIGLFIIVIVVIQTIGDIVKRKYQFEDRTDISQETLAQNQADLNALQKSADEMKEYLTALYIQQHDEKLHVDEDARIRNLHGAAAALIKQESGESSECEQSLGVNRAEDGSVPDDTLGEQQQQGQSDEKQQYNRAVGFINSRYPETTRITSQKEISQPYYWADDDHDGYYMGDSEDFDMDSLAAEGLGGDEIDWDSHDYE